MTGGSVVVSADARLTARQVLPNQGATQTTAFAGSADGRLAYGTGEGTVSLAVCQTRGLGPGASETLDLFDGSLADVFGVAAGFRVLRAYALWVDPETGDAGGLTVSGGASNPHTLFMGGTAPTKTVYPGGPADVGGSPAGVAVTSAARTVKLTNNSSTDLTYTIVLAGSPAAGGSPVGLLLSLTYAS